MLNDAVKGAEWRCKTMPNRAVKDALCLIAL